MLDDALLLALLLGLTEDETESLTLVEAELLGEDETDDDALLTLTSTGPVTGW
jgi:hypothetical protein